MTDIRRRYEFLDMNIGNTRIRGRGLKFKKKVALRARVIPIVAKCWIVIKEESRKDKEKAKQGN